jgi:hypothetical protein
VRVGTFLFGGVGWGGGAGGVFVAHLRFASLCACRLLQSNFLTLATRTQLINTHLAPTCRKIYDAKDLLLLLLLLLLRNMVKWFFSTEQIGTVQRRYGVSYCVYDCIYLVSYSCCVEKRVMLGTANNKRLGDAASVSVQALHPLAAASRTTHTTKREDCCK